MMGSASGAAGGNPNVAPSCSPNKYQQAMAMMVQMAADQKNRRGFGKNETNMELRLWVYGSEQEYGAGGGGMRTLGDVVRGHDRIAVSKDKACRVPRSPVKRADCRSRRLDAQSGLARC